MKTMQSVLRRCAIEHLNQKEHFDMEKCITLQYGGSPYWEQFFKAMRKFRYWDKVRNESCLKSKEEEQFKMIDMLNRGIEKQYAFRLQAVSAISVNKHVGEVIVCS